MVKRIFLTALLMVFSFWAASCGDDGNGSDDTVTDQEVIDDGRDQIDTPPDQPPDTPPDTPAEDMPADPAPDGIDPDIPIDGVTACEESGGYCTSYAIVPDPCVACDDGLMPAPPANGAMGCTVEGVGGVPWCCVYVVPTAEPSACETAGGECYPPASGDVCPVGWEPVYTPCREGMVCCMPTAESCFP